MPDRRTPFTNAGEKETLLEFLGYLRESLILKLDGVTDEDARRPGVPSGTSLMGLVKHLTTVEIAWFQHGFAGLDVEIPGDRPSDMDTSRTVAAAYREAIAASNEIVAGCADLDERSKREFVAPHAMSMRWLLVHMVEETGRHAGHADILREQIDGVVGR